MTCVLPSRTILSMLYLSLVTPCASFVPTVLAFWLLISFDFRAALRRTLHNIQLREGYAGNEFTKDVVNLYIDVHY